MVISEAIAYLAGWQQGSNPIGYAIRAAFLWQNGEEYHYDAGESAPLCWVLGSVEGEAEGEGEISPEGEGEGEGGGEGEGEIPECSAESPYGGEDPCYVEVILADGYCCNGEWDSICQAAYNECSGEGEREGEDEGDYVLNYSVKLGSQGMPGTAVAAQAMLEAPENDVFIGGGCTNYVRLLHTKLGLLPGDDIDALCYPPTGVEVYFEGMVGEEAGWFTPEGTQIAWHFSVDPIALGKRGTAVNNEVMTGTSSCQERLAPNEAHGDYFYTLIAAAGANVLGADEALLGLIVSGTSQQRDNDDLNALDLDVSQINRLEPQQFLQPGDLFFSLATGSPSLAMTPDLIQGRLCHEADILTPDGNGSFRIARMGGGLVCDGNYERLGIAGLNDLDALYVDATGTLFFSVKNLMPSPIPLPSANPGDILVPDGLFLMPPDGVADELIPARDLGLLDMDPITRYGTQRIPNIQDDNLDALDAETLGKFPQTRTD